ncbi:MAG: Lon family ATP-dependent protease [Syntrophomonadaceae bacterium]
MQQYSTNYNTEADILPEENTRLLWRTELIYKKLDDVYGTQGLIMRASKFDAINLMNSLKLHDRVIALSRILKKNPTINSKIGEKQIPALLDELEELLIETCARRSAEEELEQRIKKRIDQKYSDYLRDIKLEVIKELKTSPENAHTLKKLGKLEKMEHTWLSRSALDILRPSRLDEIIGQDKAVNALISRLNNPYPQHLILYGPPGVGKTTCARLALEIVKGREQSVFAQDAPFIEVDGTTLRWDPREATNPLLGSVHDPIYQGARRELAIEGIPEPKLGLVSEAHGGILFIDELGDMDPILQNKLLKVLEDKRVYFESSYYDSQNENIPRYIKQMFEKGVPADFILIGATTREREQISPAFRSRCMEIFFEPLTPENIKDIVLMSANKLGINIENDACAIISGYCCDGRAANKILVDAYAQALYEARNLSGEIVVSKRHIYEALQNSRLYPKVLNRAAKETEIGKIFGVGASAYQGCLIEIEAIAFAAERAGKGMVRFNETAGSMVRDSVFNATSVLRRETSENIKNYDLHINIVGGGRVDGPSAGAAIYLAILSAIKNKAIHQDIAITGEISLQGKVKAIGALPEKIYAARQAGIKKMLVPYDNSREVPQSLGGMEVIPIKHISQAYRYVFTE